MLSTYDDAEHKICNTVLPYVTFAYHTAIQENTGSTTFRLVDDREAVTTLDTMLPHHPRSTTRTTTLLRSLDQPTKRANLRASARSRKCPSTSADTTYDATTPISTLAMTHGPPSRTEQEAPQAAIRTVQGAAIGR